MNYLAIVSGIVVMISLLCVIHVSIYLYKTCRETQENIKKLEGK